MKIEFLLAILPCLIMAYILYANDTKEKEPFVEILKAIFMGMGAIFLTLFISSTFGLDKIDLNNTNGIFDALIKSFIYIALIEELSKFVCTYFFIYKNPNYDYVFDGIVYFGMVSIGFALAENLLYANAIGSTFLSLTLRSLTAIPSHAFFGISSGYYYSLYKLSKKTKKKYLFLSIFIPIILHGFYDFCILIDINIFTYIYIVFLAVLYIISIRKMIKLKDKDKKF